MCRRPTFGACSLRGAGCGGDFGMGGEPEVVVGTIDLLFCFGGIECGRVRAKGSRHILLREIPLTQPI